MAAATEDRPKSSTKDDDAKAVKAKEREAKERAKAKERKAEEKAKEKAKAKADREKEKAREAKAEEKARAERQKEKEREAKAKEKARAERQKEKEREEKAKEKARAERQKEKEREAKAKEKAKAERQKEKAREAKEKEQQRKAKDHKGGSGRRSGAGTGPRSKTGTSRPKGGSPKPQVHEKGWIAEELGKADAVSRSTKRPTLAASFTTRDHDVIRRWAESRGGVPADVRGTGDGNGTGGAGVLRIEFRDDQDRLEDVGWEAFFATFEDSDVDFLYQEFTKDGGESRFHKIVRADS